MTHTLRLGDQLLEVTDDAVAHSGSVDAAFAAILQRHLVPLGAKAGEHIVAMIRRERERLAALAEQAAIQTQGHPRAIYERVLKG